MKLQFPVLLLIAVFMAACSGKKNEQKEPEVQDAPIFSIREFVKDQWNLNRGLPYTFIKIVISDGKRDTTLESAFKMELGEVMQLFVNTDISDKQYSGKYTFHMFDDTITSSRSYYWEANDAKLYTQKMEMITDLSNNKVKAIFVEAAESEGRHRTGLKLYYAPKKIIRIQERKKTRLGSAKEIITEYRFPESD